MEDMGEYKQIKKYMELGRKATSKFSSIYLVHLSRNHDTVKYNSHSTIFTEEGRSHDRILICYSLYIKIK